MTPDLKRLIQNAIREKYVKYKREELSVEFKNRTNNSELKKLFSTLNSETSLDGWNSAVRSVERRVNLIQTFQSKLLRNIVRTLQFHVE